MPTTSRRLILRLDIDLVPVTFRFAHWLPRLLGADGCAIGTTVYCAQPVTFVSLRLAAHELWHVLDFVRLRHRTYRQWHALAVAWDLLRYVGQWVRACFRYDAIREEQIANAREDAILAHDELAIDFRPVERCWPLWRAEEDAA